MCVYLFHHLDTSGQVHTEVNHFPMDTFSNILLLLKYKHVMVEELLQFFVGKVDAELLEAIELMIVAEEKSGKGCSTKKRNKKTQIH